MRKIIDAIKWIGKTFHGPKDSPSYRRLTVFVFVCFSVYIGLFKAPTKDIYIIYGFTLLFILTLVGVITADKAINSYFQSKQNSNG